MGGRGAQCRGAGCVRAPRCRVEIAARAAAGPVPGLVIHYSYLWYAEHQQGHEEGRKERPCAIVAAIRNDPDGATRVLVIPVTHTAPGQPEHAVEIAAVVKERLGLDASRSWIVLSEWNEFVWPGPDLRPVPESEEGSFADGILPPRLFSIVRERFLSLVQGSRSRPVSRTE